jgi:hypothetical protein
MGTSNGPGAAGLCGGIGAGGFVTNANCPEELRGAFDTYNATFGLTVSAGFGTAEERDTPVIIGSITRGAGVSGSHYTTTSAAQAKIRGEKCRLQQASRSRPRGLDREAFGWR